MKYYCIVFLFFVSHNIFTQSIPIIDYDKLYWDNITIENLLEFYPDIQVWDVQTGDKNIKYFRHSNSGKRATFGFHKNRLFNITISFNNINDYNIIEKFLDRIQQIYGIFDSFYEENNVPVGYSHFDEKHYSRSYSENLNIYVRVRQMVSERKDFFYPYTLTCEYWNPRLYDEIYDD
jgi:hypothetical protein